MVMTFKMPAENIIGRGALAEAVNQISRRGFRHGLIVTSEKTSVAAALATRLSDMLMENDIRSTLFFDAQPNPTTANVEAGVALAKACQPDFVLSVGGGSSHDCAKGIALVAANGGSIEDYVGIDRSSSPALPVIAVNTTAGTASEVTCISVITDEKRHVKMGILDRHLTPAISVNDPETMATMPPALTAATGMDALTHAVEAYVSLGANPISDACALKAISLISASLRTAVHQGSDLAARESMAFAQLMAGMAFNNAGLGYVHAMAHPLSGHYNLGHGICNAVLLPHVTAVNAETCADRMADIAQALGTEQRSAEAAVAAIRQLSQDIGIPAGLKQLGVREADLPALAADAQQDDCAPTNPRPLTQEQIVAIYLAAM
jgi:alcohol dehydrogenase